MKRILFDHQIFRNQPYGGISKYFTELITGIRGHQGYMVLPKKFYSDNVNLAQNNLTRLSKFRQARNIPYKGRVEKLILKQEELATLDILQAGKFDVFHPTYYNPYFLNALPARKPMVLTVHDMIHENYYAHHYEYLLDETLWKRRLITRANHIIAVSQYTKNQVLKYFPQVDESKVSVIYHGITHPADSSHALKLPEKYILYVGIRKHYKNFIWLAQSLADYLKKHNITLLCAGGKDFDTYENDEMKTLINEGTIRHFTVNTDADMAVLYKNAQCFVFPSAEEGFGIPILEAFANNCPVLLSNSSCFPEVAGEAALYFEPGNIEQLLNQLDKIITRSDTRDDLIAKGNERLKQYTWENTVQQHLEIYNNLIGKQ